MEALTGDGSAALLFHGLAHDAAVPIASSWILSAPSPSSSQLPLGHASLFWPPLGVALPHGGAPPPVGALLLHVPRHVVGLQHFVSEALVPERPALETAKGWTAKLSLDAATGLSQSSQLSSLALGPLFELAVTETGVCHHLHPVRRAMMPLQACQRQPNFSRAPVIARSAPSRCLCLPFGAAWPAALLELAAGSLASALGLVPSPVPDSSPVPLLARGLEHPESLAGRNAAATGVAGAAAAAAEVAVAAAAACKTRLPECGMSYCKHDQLQHAATYRESIGILFCHAAGKGLKRSCKGERHAVSLDQSGYQ